MTPRLLMDLVVRPTLATLAPQAWDSGHAFLVAIAIQESGLRHRDQIDASGKPGNVGPATSLWQMELAGGFRGVETHPKTIEVMLRARKALLLPENERARWASICWNDAYACLLARGLIYTHPQALPTGEDDAWEQYLELWRPGKPHRATWNSAYWKALQCSGR